MADIKDVEYVIKRMEESRPTEFQHRIDDTNMGIGAVLKFLSETDGELTCGDIAKKMNVSTARVAVLLKKMEAKGLIERHNAVGDARIIYVSLSAHGLKVIEEFRRAHIEQISKVIDVMGMEKIKTFLDLSEELLKVSCETRPSKVFFDKDNK